MRRGSAASGRTNPTSICLLSKACRCGTDLRFCSLRSTSGKCVLLQRRRRLSPRRAARCRGGAAECRGCPSVSTQRRRRAVALRLQLFSERVNSDFSIHPAYISGHHRNLVYLNGYEAASIAPRRSRGGWTASVSPAQPESIQPRPKSVKSTSAASPGGGSTDDPSAYRSHNAQSGCQGGELGLAGRRRASLQTPRPPRQPRTCRPPGDQRGCRERWRSGFHPGFTIPRGRRPRPGSGPGSGGQISGGPSRRRHWP